MSTDEPKTNTADKPKKKTKYLGPHGLGDPDDKFLRVIEKQVIISKKMRDIARKELCTTEVAEFCECAKAEKLLIVFNCRNQNAVMQKCLQGWYNNVEFRERCTQEYLEERRQYRLTGIGKKQRDRLEALRAKVIAQAKDKAQDLSQS